VVLEVQKQCNLC